MKSYTGLKAILISKLGAVKGKDNKELLYVYGEAEATPEGYPACFVIEDAGSGDILDTQRNQREWQFIVDIVQEVGRKTPAEARAALLDATDRVIEIFDQDPMLKDEHDQSRCMQCRVVPSEFNITSEGEIINKMTVAIVDIVNRFAIS